MEEYICPLCDNEMTEEEGLYWCDSCGINNQSKTYLDMQEKYSK